MVRNALLCAAIITIIAACSATPETAQQQRTAPATAAAAESASNLGSVKDLDSRSLADDPEKSPGAALYKQSCQMCHDGQVAKAPQKMFLQMLSGPTIQAAMVDGIMAAQASALTIQQKQQVAEYLSGLPLAAATPTTPVKMCSANDAWFDAGKAPLESGWGYDNARLVAAKDAGLTKSQAADLELKWAFEYPGAIRTRSQPAIAYGAVFVGSQDGHVYALDLKSGCARWVFKAGAEVRTAIVPYQAMGGANMRTQSPRLLFGDLIARLYSVDAATGKLLWSQKVHEHSHATLTGTPAVHDGVAYVPVSSLEVTSAGDPNYPCCTFRGAIVAIDLWSGIERWRSYSVADLPKQAGKTSLGVPVFSPSGAPIWNSPTIDEKRRALYVGTGENYSSPATATSDALLALSLQDGKLLWSRQTVANDVWNVACMMKDNPNCPPENGPDVDFGAGTILTRLANGRELIVAGQKNGVVYGFDPDRQGAIVWQTRVGRGGIQGGIHFGMAMDRSRIYAPVTDMRDAHDGRPTDGPPRPGIYALNASDGKLLWSTPASYDFCGARPLCDAGISQAITAIPGAVFAGHLDGRFRTYDGDSGKVLFEFDANQELTTVSGAKARGGSFGGGGPAVRDGYVIVNSGYGMYFHMPGNVLLAFGPR